MRAGILIVFLIVGLATSLPVSAAEDNNGATQGSRAAPPDAAKKEPAPPPSVTVIGARDALGILGREVRSAANENMGRIVDVIVDREGKVRAAVIDFGGFLGVGNRQIAVAWNAIRLSSQGKQAGLVVDFTRDQLRVAPAYKAGEQVVLLGPAEAPAAASTNVRSDKEAPHRQPPSDK